jgi:MSHA biogenesis protein MshP
MTCNTGLRSMVAGRLRTSRGLGSIAAIIVLVLLAALAAAIVRIGSGTQASQAADILGARALQAARAGNDWGMYQALKASWASCAANSQTLDLSADTGMHVTVTCHSTLYNEGEASPGVPQTRRAFTIDAVACNAPHCPDDTTAVGAGYIERRRVVQVMQ